MRIAIALFENAEELDWAGPWEVLAAWAKQFPDDGVEVVTVADSLEPVRCAKGLRVLADTTWDELGKVDVLV
jgi:transcriptional regulator GlxA family with amidase domain